MQCKTGGWMRKRRRGTPAVTGELCYARPQCGISEAQRRDVGVSLAGAKGGCGGLCIILYLAASQVQTMRLHH